MKAIQKELGESDDRAEEVKEVKKRIEEAKMPEKVARRQRNSQAAERMHPDTAGGVHCKEPILNGLWSFHGAR